MQKLFFLMILKTFSLVFLKSLFGKDEETIKDQGSDYVDKILESGVDFLSGIGIETLGSNVDEFNQYRDAKVNFNLAKALLKIWSEKLKNLERQKKTELKNLSSKEISITATRDEREYEKNKLENERDFLAYLSRKFREARNENNFVMVEEIFVYNLKDQNKTQSAIFTALKNRDEAEKLFWNSIKSSAVKWTNGDEYSLPVDWNRDIPESLGKEIQYELFENLESAIAEKIKTNQNLEKTLGYYLGLDTNNLVKDLLEIIKGEGEPEREIVIKYLEEIISKADELPKYLIDSKSNQGKADLFTHIRQKVEVYDSEKFDELRKEYEQQDNKQNFNLTKLRKSVERIEWKEENTKDFHRLIILGNPGVGKSWLLRYEAKRLAKKIIEDLKNPETQLDEIILPVWVNLTDWALRGETNFPISALADLVIESFTGVRPDNRKDFNIFQVWLMRKIRSENCLILLDALDEIPRDKDFTRKLKIFSDLEAKSARIYITCREAEYKGSPIVSREKPIKEIKLLEFEDEQIGQFYEAWFGKDSEKARQFKDILEDNFSIEELARIPLLLSLLCALFDETEDINEFPKKRGEVYEQCIHKIFMKEWKDRIFPEGILREPRSREMLSWIGFQIFSQIGEQFTERVLFEKIKEWLIRNNYTVGIGDVDNIIQQLRDDGLLTIVSKNENRPEQNRYTFLHRTFLEFFAACGLAELQKDADGKIWEEIVFQENILFDPHWTEVLQLLGGRLSTESAEKYINKLLEISGKKGEGDILFRPLKLAANVFAESNEEVKNLTGDKITGEIIEKYLYTPEWLTDKWFISWLKVLGDHVINSLLLKLDEVKNYRNRRSIVWALGEIKIKNEKITDTLNAVINDSNENEFVRRSAAESLININEVSETSVNFLADFFINKKKRFVNKYNAKQKELLRIRNLEILVKLDNTPQKVIDYAIEVLKDKRQDYNARKRIAAALLELKNPPEIAEKMVNSSFDWKPNKNNREQTNSGKNIFDKEFLSESKIYSLMNELESIRNDDLHKSRFIIEALSKQTLSDDTADRLIEIILDLPNFKAGFHRQVIIESLFRVASERKKAIPLSEFKNNKSSPLSRSRPVRRHRHRPR